MARGSRGGTKKVRRTGGPSYGEGRKPKAGKPKSKATLTKGEKADKLSERIRKKVMAKSPATTGKRPAASISAKPSERWTGGTKKPAKAASGASKTAGKVLGGAAKLAGGLAGAYAAGTALKGVADYADKNYGYKGKGRQGITLKKKAAKSGGGPSKRPNNASSPSAKPTAKTSPASPSFGEAFKAARAKRLKGGAENFTWNGKTYHSYTKEEMAKKKAKPSPRSTGYATGPEYRPKGPNKPKK